MRSISALRGASASITNSVINLLVLLLASAAFAACSTDEPEEITSPRLVPVPITITTEKPDYYGGTPPADAGTRAIDWEAINNLDILVFNGETRVYRRYFSSSELGQGMTLDVPEGTNLVAYAFANVASNVFDNIKTLTDLNNATCPISNWDDIAKWSTIPMSGRSNSFNVVLGGGAPSISFVLRRIAARLDITLTGPSGVTISSMKLVNLPNKTYYLSRPLDTERQLIDDNAARTDKDAVVAGNTGDWIAESGTQSAKTYTFYLFENRPGVSSNTNEAQKGAKSNDTRATYLFVTGEDKNYTMEWTLYFGGDATKNYNIKRNCVYTINATLKYAAATTDVRVKSVAKNPWALPDDGAASGAWAGSNIYWDGSKLTFDGAGTTSNQYYQGVFFQWGSLVGISPAQHNSSDDWNENVTVYVSTTYTGPASGGKTKPTYSSKTASAAGYSNYFNIPYENGSFTTYGRSQNHLYYSDQATKTSKWGGGKGDICQYLGEIGAAPSGYRMPISNQFGADGDWSTGGTFSIDNTLGTANGKKSLSGKGYVQKGSSPYFPAAGWRNANGGMLDKVGIWGNYWSSSADKIAGNKYRLYFSSSSDVSAGSYGDKQIGGSVRCIKD